jgi:hypothetical protein
VLLLFKILATDYYSHRSKLIEVRPMS